MNSLSLSVYKVQTTNEARRRSVIYRVFSSLLPVRAALVCLLLFALSVLCTSRCPSYSSRLFPSVSVETPCFPMESLQLTRVLSCKSSTNISHKGCSFRPSRQLGFGHLLRRSSQNGNLTVVRSEKTGVGFIGLTEGSNFNAVEDEKEERKEEEKEKRGLMLGIERDDSGSVIGMHLVPPGDHEVIDDEENVVTGTKDKDEEIEEEKLETRVTYNIVFVTSEAAPYSKTGGLGDVCGSLPIALAGRGHRVMVVSPRYLNGTSADNNFAGAFDVDRRIKLHRFEGEQEIAFFHEYREGVDWVFVDHPCYHRPGNPYGDSHGAFGDNQFRHTLLCHAACEAPLVLPLGGYTYGEKCLFLVNDWHAGLVPVLLASKYRPYGVYKDARSILVIHNLSHQGVEPAASYKSLGLPSDRYGALEWVFPTWARTHALDTEEAVNILKAAIVTADRILTVSKGYAWEITTVEGGYGLNELLSNRRSVLNGIANCIDVAEWDPSSDEHIAFHYSGDDLSGKVKCKTVLQQELGLPIKPECPLIGFIGRLDYQKGIDLIRWATPQLMEDDVQFVVLGSGDPLYEDWMRSAETTYEDKFRGWVGFNVPISHRITAGCDILLMPSRFEPCGLNQLYAMRYATVPVVHATGGLRDTVGNFNPYAGGGTGEGTGWTFSPLTKDSMLNALRIAIMAYREHKSTWEGLMRRCMQRDLTWESAAIQYEQVFEWAFIDPPYIH